MCDVLEWMKCTNIKRKKKHNNRLAFMQIAIYLQLNAAYVVTAR